MSRLSYDEVIQQITKREIPASDEGTIPTLNDLPTWMVEEARAIARESRLSARRYLRFYVATHYLSSAEDFIEDVLEKRKDAATWQIRDCIDIPEEQVPTTALESRYLEVFDGIDGERWFRIRSLPGDIGSSPFAGMVGVVRRNTRYWESAPSGFQRYLLTEHAGIDAVPLTQLQGSVRRWIAHRIAWWTRSYLQRHPDAITGSDLITAVPDADPTRVTPDAWIAASALAREAAAFRDSPQFPQQAGFLGPDEWYQTLPPLTVVSERR